jgi:long-chain acyl-CoA synthetase
LGSLLQRIERIAREQPVQIALQHADRRVTYSEMMDHVCSLSGALASHGIGKGDAVAMVVPNSPEFVICHLALMKLGAVTVSFHPEHPPSDVAARLTQIPPRALIVAGGMARTLTEPTAAIPSIALRVAFGSSAPEGWLRFEDLLSNAGAIPEVELEPADLAAIVFTSGVSGPPRGVELSYESFAHQATQAGRTLRVRSTDRVAGTCSFASIFGLTLGVHLPLAHGATVQITGASDEANIAGFIHEHSTTIFVGSPQTYAKVKVVAGTAPADAQALRYLICCGGRLAPDVREGIESQWKRPVLSGYGLTETCGLVSVRLYPMEEHVDSVGEPLADMEVAILDVQGQRVGAGKPGRIAVRGPAVMRGYWGQPEGATDVIRDGWLRTDDIGSLDYHSRLTVHGLSSEMITKGGFVFYASEVEEVLRAHPAIREAAVIGIADAAYGEELKAFIVCNNGTTIGSNEIIDHAKAKLPVYKCPRIIRFCKELPRTREGKISRGLLRDDRA